MVENVLEEFGIPESYGEELWLFKKHGLEYVLFKQTPLMKKRVDGLDIIFRNKEDMLKAKTLLEGLDFVVLYSERNEPFKIMMMKMTPHGLKTFHLHRRLAWIGLEVLCTDDLFKRSEEANKLARIPSKEDTLIIHAAHALFENYVLCKAEVQLVRALLKEKIDWDYINSQLYNYGWRGSFYRLLKLVESCDGHDLRLGGSLIARAHLEKFFDRRLLKNFLLLYKQSIVFISRRVGLRRRGFLVALIGVNGTGKTTLTSEAKRFFEKNDCIGKVSSYYFGWGPSFPLTRLLSAMLKRRKLELYESAGKKEGPKSSLVNLLLFYDFFEYIWRYLVFIYPLLRKDYIVFCDRYYYDLPGQYVQSRESGLINILIKLFPRPDKVFLLECNFGTLRKRRKNVSPEFLMAQMKRYRQVAELLGVDGVIKTDKEVEKSVTEIVKHIWHDRCEKVSI